MSEQRTKKINNFFMYKNNNLYVEDVSVINIANNINKTQISKVYVYGKDINYTFNKLRTQKKGKILKSNSEILRFISNEINNNDYLMVKGSNSTGLNEIIKKLN